MKHSFLKEHFDHLLLVFLAIVGAAAGLWADVKGHDQAANWMFTQSAGTIAALLMRMQLRKPAAGDALPADVASPANNPPSVASPSSNPSVEKDPK